MFVDQSPMARVMASECEPVWAMDELMVTFVMPLPPPEVSPAQPSAVPDSKPQFMQAGPVVQETAAMF